MTSEPGDNLPKPPPEIQEIPAEEPQTNGVPQPVQLDAISPFSQPPAPPPQQPLPEKPDMPRYNIADSIPVYSLKRSNTEKPTSGLNSPTKPELPSSQILSLVEALSTAKREIDSQGDRVKHLEVLLRRERKARESAEERARSLLEGRHASPDGGQEQPVEMATLEPPAEPLEQAKSHLSNGCDAEREEKAAPNPPVSPINPSTFTIKNSEESHRDTDSANASTSRLQEKLDLMVKEMNEMRLAMEGYKRRAEGAELERKGLAEMVEQIRASNSNPSNGNAATVATASNDDISLQSSVAKKPSSHLTSPDQNASSSSPPSTAAPQRPQNSPPSGDAATNNMRELHRTLSTALQARQWGRDGSGELAMQSAPYVSMVGVVLIGVGIMTWLNGWQKVDR